VNPTAFKAHEGRVEGLIPRLWCPKLKCQISKDGFKTTITTKLFSPKQAGVG